MAMPMGVCYGPYHQKDKPWGSYTAADINADMAIITKYFHHIRTYSMQDAGKYIVGAAHSHGIRVSLGTWIFKDDWNRTQQEIDAAIKQAVDFPGAVIHLVVGNEVNRPEQNYSPDEVTRAITYAKAQASSRPNLNLDVTSCFSGTVLQPGNPSAGIWKGAVQACMSYVFLTIYPWYGNSQPGNIDGNMKWSYDNGMKQVEALGKGVIIGEIGWTSQGGRETSVQNEELNYKTTNKWVLGDNFLKKNYLAFWFEMFDEPWKTQEGSFGPYWGLYGSGANPSEKFKIPPRVAAKV